MIDIIEVNDVYKINIVEKMARKIWNEHYTPIIGQAQVDYMLSKFQSASAIQKQIEEGYQYFLSLYDDEYGGYFAVKPDFEKKSMFLSKLYVDRDFRKKGMARAAISYIEKLCSNLGLNSIWLTVNKNNKGSISAYKKMGFEIVKPIVQDIGSGFVMDDYMMEKRLSI